MSNLCCPADEELIPVLAGETTNPEIASHINECSVCRRRLDTLRSDLDALRSVLPAGPPAAPGPARRPAVIGKYLVVGTLGSGGQAEVFLAVHPTLDKELVVKLGRPTGRLSENRALLVAEGKLLARLDHPGLARVYDLDFHDDRPFLVMEYVRGQTLWQYGGGRPVPPRKAAALAAGAARALEAVHKHGIIHQDVKPQNILVDETGRPRLIDFGMARLRHAWDDTGDRMLGGTPAFMAPEQARGEEAKVSPRSDVFAAGAVLYYLLTGRPPFDAPDAAAALNSAGRCEFDRAALDRPGIPRRLRDACLKAMAADPGDRYARAEELADDLERFLSRTRRLARVAAVAGVVLAGAVVAGLAFRTPPVTGPGGGPPAAGQPAEVGPPVEVRITRGGETLGLLSALPLDPVADRVEVVARVPPGHHAVLLHVDAKGNVKKLDPKASPADGYTRLVYPGDGKVAPFVPGLPGTEFVLVCAAEDPAALDDLELLVGSLLRLPPLPPKTVVWLGRDEPRREGRSTFGKAEPDPAAEVEAQLDLLRRRLRDKPLSVIRGVAYAR
jgi:aminoglycoside phosphotransferase (APT) family kinase protein